MRHWDNPPRHLSGLARILLVLAFLAVMLLDGLISLIR